MYVYCSSLPVDKEKEIEEENQTNDKNNKYVTGRTLLSIQRITYDYKTGGDIKISIYNQVDPKLGFALKMAAKMMPKLTQQWFENFGKHLETSLSLRENKTNNLTAKVKPGISALSECEESNSEEL